MTTNLGRAEHWVIGAEDALAGEEDLAVPLSVSLAALLDEAEARGESRGAERDRANAERFARYIVWKCPNERDHACAQCYPNGDAVVWTVQTNPHAASAYAVLQPRGQE